MIVRSRLRVLASGLGIVSAIVAPRSEALNGQSNGSNSNCVTTGTPLPTAIYTYRSRQGGTIATFTYRWLEYSETGSRLEVAPVQPNNGRGRIVTTTSHSFRDDLVVVDSYTATGTNAAGTFTTRTVHRPALITGPALHVCQGQTWRGSPVQITATTTPGRTSTDRVTVSGEVVSVHEPVTVEAGTFDAVHFRQTQTSPQSSVVVNVWRSIKDGVTVRMESTSHGTAVVETLISRHDGAK